MNGPGQVPEAPIPGVIGRIHASVDRLGTTLEVLESRLKTVLSTAPTAANKESASMQGSSPVVGELVEIERTVNAFWRRVEELNQRLEV